MSTTLMFEILQEQLDEARREDNYVPSAGLKKLVDVCFRKNKIQRARKLSKKKSSQKHKKVKRKRI